ncbi:MAG TPA: patatin-like phospholipase family protein [Pyrinomonadaceae bacterium]|nr:patatin-like phospholipase family protein [Pyrinomonadaceae bacterium]
MPTHDYPYKNLVFEGGGVKGVAYGGVFEVLEERQITPQIEAVAGTSAGAITATMMALNYSTEHFLKIMMTLNFEKLEDGCELIAPFRLIRRFGWFKGNYFLKLMESYIEQKTRDGQAHGNGRATFRDLVEKYADRHFKRLTVFGTNLTQQAVQKFSYETTPDVAVADAVRISMSIPFFFEARYYEQNGSNDAYCDGGVLNNYPIDTFDEQHTEVDRDSGQRMLLRTPNRETLGFHFVDPIQPASPINSLRSFTGGVIDALLDIQDILLKTNPGDERRSVFINDLGVKFTDFALSDQTKRALIDQGRIATIEYLDKPQPRLPEIKRLLSRG